MDWRLRFRPMSLAATLVTLPLGGVLAQTSTSEASATLRAHVQAAGGIDKLLPQVAQRFNASGSKADTGVQRMEASGRTLTSYFALANVNVPTSASEQERTISFMQGVICADVTQGLLVRDHGVVIVYEVHRERGDRGRVFDVVVDKATCETLRPGGSPSAAAAPAATPPARAPSSTAPALLTKRQVRHEFGFAPSDTGLSDVNVVAVGGLADTLKGWQSVEVITVVGRPGEASAEAADRARTRANAVADALAARSQLPRQRFKVDIGTPHQGGGPDVVQVEAIGTALMR